METIVSLVARFGPLAVFLVIGGLGLFFVVFPLLRLLAGRTKKAPPAAAPPSLSKQEADALVEELEASLSRGKPTLTDQERISRLARSDPERARDLVRRWLHE